MVKINVTHLGYMSVFLGKQVVLVVHTQFREELCFVPGKGGVWEWDDCYLHSVQAAQLNYIFHK